MKIYLREITDLDQEYVFTEKDAWALDCVLKSDEISEEDQEIEVLRKLNPSSQRIVLKDRQLKFNVSLRDVDNFIVGTGNLKTEVHMLCSRCGCLAVLPINTHFYSLFCQDPSMSGVGYLDQNKPKGQNKGVARSEHIDDPNDPDVDITYIAKDYIDLQDILGEQLQLQIPYQPLCASDCKGICTQCGTNLNRGKCACLKVYDNPFARLKILK